MLQNNITPFLQPDQSQNSVSIVNIRPNPKPGGSVLAYADVKVGPVLIRGISVVKNKKGGEFVAFPARSGGTQWFSIVEIDEPVRGQIIECVLEAWRGLHA